LDVIKIYEDYDRTERIAFKVDRAKTEEAYNKERCIYELSQVGEVPTSIPYQVPFRHLCNLLQIYDGDIEKIMSVLQGVKPEQAERIRQRARCAANWLNGDAPDDYRFSLRGPGEKVDFNEAELRAIRNLREFVVMPMDTFRDDRACADAIYKTAEVSEVDGNLMFRVTYQALIGKDYGPRLANFLRVIKKERLLGILSAY
jgi:lysyl-tRNA synthetase class 1